jgi:hypothetical protein
MLSTKDCNLEEIDIGLKDERVLPFSSVTSALAFPI